MDGQDLWDVLRCFMWEAHDFSIVWFKDGIDVLRSGGVSQGLSGGLFIG